MDIKTIKYKDISKGSHEIVIPGEMEPTPEPSASEPIIDETETSHDTEATFNDEQSDQQTFETEQ